MPWVHLLRCADGSFHVGSAPNLDQRFAEHDQGRVKGFTSMQHPVGLVWALETERVDDASELERQIEGWRRGRRPARIEGRPIDLPGLLHSGSHATTSSR